MPDKGPAAKFRTSLPLAETLGVFLGVSSIGWLADGYAEPRKAALIAVAAGALICLARLLGKRAERD